MADLPIMLHVNGRLCVVVGGGDVALRRTAALLRAGARVRVVAPVVAPELAKLPVEVISRTYIAGDLEGALLVVAATNCTRINQQVGDDARAAGVLVNRTDVPQDGDFSVPAHAGHGPVTLAVHTQGISATASAIIRRQLSAALDPDWPRLLELIAPFRARIREQFPQPGPRHERLAMLGDEDAWRTLKEQGPEALLERCRRLASSE